VKKVLSCTAKCNGGHAVR